MVGVDPVIKLTGPIPATKRILERAGLRIADFDLFEINEAFASVIGAWLREIGAPLEHVNVNGGAIALGHPVGASGGRLITTATTSCAGAAAGGRSWRCAAAAVSGRRG